MELLTALVQRRFGPQPAPEGTDVIQEYIASEQAAGQASSPRTLVLVRGKSGMGKSRLIHQVTVEAKRLDVRVKEIHCYERQGIPFLPVLRIVKDLISESTSREPLWQKYARVLTRVFPELAAVLGEARNATALAGEDGKLQLFDALAEILLEISRERPLLLCFHDLHRSDHGTIEFLRLLGRYAFLDDVVQRRNARGAQGEGGRPEDWKEIRNREGKIVRDFITDGLHDAEVTTDAEGSVSGARLMVIANYLELDTVASEPAEERRAPAKASPAEVVAACDAAEASFSRALLALKAEPFAIHISLPPLTQPEMGVLIAQLLMGRAIPESYLARMLALAAGNPLHARELCRAFLEAESALLRPMPATNGARGGIPGEFSQDALALLDHILEDLKELRREGEMFRHLLHRRLGLLGDPHALRVLDSLAVLRRPVQTLLLQKILELPAEQVDALLQLLVSRGFVQQLIVEQGPRFALAHEDYNRSLYENLSEDAQFELHGRIARVLSEHDRAAEPVRAFEIYEHFRESSSPRDCFPFGRAAARYFAEAYAIDLAVAIDDYLLALLEEPDDLLPRLEVLQELAELEYRRGNILRAKSHIKRLLDDGARTLVPMQRLVATLLLSDIYLANKEAHKGIKVLNRAQKTCASIIDQKLAAHITARLAGLRLARNDVKRAANLALSGLKSIEDAPGCDPERIELLEILAESHRARGEMVGALQHYQTLLGLVERAGDDSKLASVLTTLGRVYYDRGNYFRAARYLFRALDAIRRKQDLRALSRAYDSLGKVYRNSGDLLRGLEYFNRSLRLRERIGDMEALSPTLNSLGSLYAHKGDYLRAIRYFKRSIENSERMEDTAGIVRSFLHLGRAYFEIGEIRQAENLAKQILILAQEFHYLVLEGEGHRLNGELLLLRRDWRRAERELRRAIELAAKSGRKNGEAWATLALGELLYEKEDYDNALKYISRGQFLADEVQSVPLKARGHLLKGNVCRFLKEASAERAKESFQKGLDLVAGENHLPILWDIHYSLAKLHQADLDFVQAGEAYRRAEEILERIVARLPDDMRVVYRDDSRRKTFADDYRRFQKEASGRQGVPVAAPQQIPAQMREEKTRVIQRPAAPAEGAPANDKLLDALGRLGAAESFAAWTQAFFQESRKLVPSPAGCLFGVTDGALQLLESADMPADRVWVNADRVPGAMVRAAIERSSTIVSGDAAWQETLASVGDAHGYRNRSVLVLPITLGARSVGALFLERPSVGNPFTEAEQSALKRLVAASAGPFVALADLDRMRRFGGTSLLSPSGFEQRLGAIAAQHLDGSQRVFFAQIRIAGFESAFLAESNEAKREQLAARAATLVPGDALLHAYGGDDALVYVFDSAKYESISAAKTLIDEACEAYWKELGGDRPTAGAQIAFSHPEPEVASAADLSHRMRNRLLHRGGTFNVEREIDHLTNGELSLKDAKIALERRYITAQLHRAGGNITRAAGSLGVHRPQLSNLMKKHKVRREEIE